MDDRKSIKQYIALGKRFLIAIVSCAGAVLIAHQTDAGLIDFELGFSDGDALGLVDSGDNMVNFSVGLNAASAVNAHIADVGNTVTGFIPGDKPADDRRLGPGPPLRRRTRARSGSANASRWAAGTKGAWGKAR